MVPLAELTCSVLHNLTVVIHEGVLFGIHRFKFYFVESHLFPVRIGTRHAS